MRLTADDAKELAQCFRDLSVSLGNFRLNNWGNLSSKERTTIESKEWTLLNYSSDFITEAVGLILDDAEGSLKNIKQATSKAKGAIENIKIAKSIINIATSVIGLGGAIGAATATKDPTGIAAAIENVITSINGATG